MEKERLNILVNCNDISFFNSFSIFVGRPSEPTDLLSFNDKIKLVISSELAGLRKKSFRWDAGEIHQIIYLKI